MELNIAQEIYLHPEGNAARYNKDMRTAYITKIGRKYFETDRFGRFVIETMMHDGGEYMSQYKAFTSVEDYNMHTQTPKLREELIKAINSADWDTLLKIKLLLS